MSNNEASQAAQRDREWEVYMQQAAARDAAQQAAQQAADQHLYEQRGAAEAAARAAAEATRRAEAAAREQQLAEFTRRPAIYAAYQAIRQDAQAAQAALTPEEVAQRTEQAQRRAQENRNSLANYDRQIREAREAQEAQRARELYGNPIVFERAVLPGPFRQEIAHSYALPDFAGSRAPAQNVFTTIPYTPAEIEARQAEHHVIHPKYNDFITLPDSHVKAGYLEGCKILHGYFSPGDGDLYNNKLSTNHNQPDDGGTPIKISADFTPIECYNGINQYLKVENAINKSKFTWITAGNVGVDVGGLSRQFSNVVGDYIKTTFMKSIITDTESQAGGASAAPSGSSNNNASPAAPSAAPVNNASPSASASSNNNASPSASAIAVNNAPCPAKEKFDLSPMDFVLPNDNQGSIIDLANILAYYAFVVSRINSNDRSKLNLGINFSAFALIILFDKSNIIQDIIDILETLSTKKTTTTGNNNKTKKVNDYFHLKTVVMEGVEMPTYKNPDRRTEFKEIDNQIELLIGKLYAVEELYDRGKFTDTFTSNISGNYELQLHDEFFRLLKKLTHTHVNETLNSTDNQNTIWDDVIKELLLKFNNLKLLGTKFRSFYTPELQVLNTEGTPVSIDLFSLGECIRQPGELSADAIKSIIIYVLSDDVDDVDDVDGVGEEQKIIVQGAINKFLNDNNDNKTMLRKFLKFITGDISLPRQITCKIFPIPNNTPIFVHTCFHTIDFYNNIYSNADGTEITNSDDKIKAIVDVLTVAVNIIEFNMSGGARLRRTRNSTTRYKKHHKHTTLRNNQRNKQRKSKKQQYKSIRRVSTRNNKKSTRSKRR